MLQDRDSFNVIKKQIENNATGPRFSISVDYLFFVLHTYRTIISNFITHIPHLKSSDPHPKLTF